MDLLSMLFLIVVLTLWVYLLIAERKVRSKTPLWIRYTASSVALAAVAGLLFPVSVAVGPHPEPDTATVAVYTRGTPAPLLNALGQHRTGVTTDTAIARRHKLPLIRDWPSFSETLGQKPLAVYGYGLTSHQLGQLPANGLTYHRPPLPQGIMTCDWPMQLQSSAMLTVRGKYYHSGAQAARLVLLSASVPVDSAVIDTPGVHLFTLAHQPRQQGNTLFELVAISGNDTIQAEKIPVAIHTPKARHVFMLAAAPSSEHRFLANWFETMHDQVASRTRISRDRFSVKTNAAMSLPAIRAPLRQSTFSNTDLLIADEAEVAALSRGEQAIILDAVARGMGLVLLKRADSEPPLPGLGFHTLGARSTMGKPVTIAGMAGATYPELLLPAVVPLRMDESLRPVLRIDGHTVAATRLYGQGRITATTLAGTYRWWLTGDRAAYARFWSTVIDQALVDAQPPLRYVQTPLFPTPFSWVTLALETTASPILVDGQPHPTRQHAYLTPFHEVSLWLPQAGWHTVQAQPVADTAFFYVYGAGEWQTARDYTTIAANEAAARNHRLRQGDAPAVPADVRQRDLPKWPFVVIFFIAAAVLWYASRDYNQNVM